MHSKMAFDFRGFCDYVQKAYSKMIMTSSGFSWYIWRHEHDLTSELKPFVLLPVYSTSQ